MKKIIIVVLTVMLWGSLFLPVFALDLGLGDAQKAANKAGYADATETSLAEIIGGIIKAVLSLVGVIFTFLLAYAGDMWMGARGDDTKIEKAKAIITGSIFGLITTLAAYTISNFAVNAVLERATGTGN